MLYISASWGEAKIPGCYARNIMRYNTLNMDILQILDNVAANPDTLLRGVPIPTAPPTKPDTRKTDGHSTGLGPGAKEAGLVAE